MPMLFITDEQQNMINRYLERGIMYILNDNGIKAVCVVTIENNNTVEIKNIAVIPEYQRRGYGKTLINFIITKYKNEFDTLQVGTGDVPSAITFYEKCGFSRSHIVKNFLLKIMTTPFMKMEYNL